MGRQQWKVAEERLGTFFETKRRPLSGLNHGTGRGDDCLHDTFYLESKYGLDVPLVRHAVACYQENIEKMKRDGVQNDMVPVIGIQKKNLPGILFLIHSNDLENVCIEYLHQLGYQFKPPEEVNGQK